MSYLTPMKYNIYLTLGLFLISCSGPDELDLSNIESEVITFYENETNETEENNFPSMMISTISGQQIVDEPKINANLTVIENKNEINYKIGIEVRGSSSQMFPK